MKYFFTLLLFVSVISSKSQTPVAQTHHGCGGATIAAYPADPTWTNVTYMFQRFQGGNWVTVHTNTNNWHMVTSGDITVISNYRAVLRNNVTLEERTSNGVTIDPALFNNPVLPPNPQATMYWGTDITGGVNYVEFLPFPDGSPFAYRPPFTFEQKKTTDAGWQNRISTNGFFLFPIDANAQYQFRVTDACGVTSNIITRELVSTATALFDPAASNCSGGTIQVGVQTNGFNFPQRFPFTFGIALLPPGTPTNPVPDAILDSIVYQYPVGNISGLAHGQYLVRGRDRFGVLTKYTLVTITVAPPAPPFVVSYGGSGGYCQYFATLQSNPNLKGIRPAGSSNPYVFSTGLTFSNLQGGQTYEMVLKDTCGTISAVDLLPLLAVAPRINSTSVTVSSCKYVITVNANVCSTPEYGIKLNGSSTISWQTSNVFGNLSMIETCDSIFVKDIASGLITKQEVCKDGLVANISSGRDNPDCLSNYYTEITPVTGVPPYNYSISYDGINFSSPVSSATFSNLVPGIYTLRATDACGLPLQTSATTVELGSVFYLKQSGVNANCTNGDTLGGYLKFGLRIFNDDQLLFPPPYHYIIKEVTSINGNDVQYGNIVFSGQTSAQNQDTIITIKGLDGNKSYGFFVTNNCGQSFISANRVLNVFFIPVFSSPAPEINIDSTNCAMPFIQANSLPAGALVRIFSGTDTTGTLQAMVNDSTSTVLQGGFYSVKISTANFNGCYWEKVYRLFIETDASTSAGQFDPNVSSGFCAGISDTVSLYNNIINETPGGVWSSSPALNWSNQSAGEFIPADQATAIYNITYTVTSYCGITRQVNFQVSTDLGYCNLSPQGDYESAMTTSGCKTYTGNGWKHVFNSSGNLVYSINAGAGNTIQSACWGIRAVNAFGNPRSTVINGSTVYFAARNFYIEPSAFTTPLNPPARIRLYYTGAEITQLLSYLQSNGFPAATVNNLRILKKKFGPGSPVNLDVAYDPGASTSLYTIITPVAVPYNSPFDYYFEFEMSSFSELAVVFTNNVTLPVTWLSINGKLQNNTAIIEWATASESNSSHFEIEHSNNGVSFTKAGTVNAAGNSSSTSNYSFTHLLPVAGKNYYRIKQVDLDGRFTYSRIVTLINNNEKNSIVISPNPAQDFIQLNTNISKPATIRIYSMEGKLVQQQQIPAGNQQRSIDISKLPAGMYSLQLQTSELLKTASFIKH